MDVIPNSEEVVRDSQTKVPKPKVWRFLVNIIVDEMEVNHEI